MEREEDEGGSLLLGARYDVLVDRLEVGDGSHGADGDVAELLVGLEGDHELVAAVLVALLLVPEGEAVAPGLVDHGDGGRPLRQLHQVHGVDSDAAAPSATGGLDQVDHGGDVSAAVEAGQDAELALCVVAQDAAVLVRRGTTCGLVDGHHYGRGDESGEQGHQHQYGERLVVENLSRLSRSNDTSTVLKSEREREREEKSYVLFDPCRC